MHIAVYTAIFDGYDDPPAIERPDPSLSYILFCDETVKSAPSPWELRRVPPIFADPQRDARRVKALPHLYLPEEFDISVWIDANCTIKSLSAASILQMIGDAELAVPAHAERRCSFAEAETLVSLGYDSPARIMRQVMTYRLAGFPANFGLHHTNFVIRHHRREGCIRFCTAWWREIGRHSKRDQLSFDFIRWRLPQSRVQTLAIDYTVNSLFQSAGTHRLSRRVASEHLHVAVRRDELSAEFLAAPYVADYDVWPVEFIKHLRRLNEIVAASGEPLEGNLCYFHRQSDTRYAPPDPRRGARRETYLRAVAGHRRLLEIGFNAGHSSLLALTHSDATVTSIDNAAHAYTAPAAAYLRDAFPSRFTFVGMDSSLLPMAARKLDFGGHDMIHIDGGHEPNAVANDLACAVAFGRPGMLVLVDDIYIPPARHMTNRLLGDGLLAPYGDLETLESGAYVVLEPAHADAIRHTDLMDRLLEDFEGAMSGRWPHDDIKERSDGAVPDRPDPPGPEVRPETAADKAAVLPIDAGIAAEIRRIGVHPFVLVRMMSEGDAARFAICHTQNDAADFARQLAEVPVLGNSKLLRAIECAMCVEVGEAAALMHAWMKESGDVPLEQIYLGLPLNMDLQHYYGYPVFEIGPATIPNDPSLRLNQLIALMQAYQAAEGNDRSRHILIEAMALAVARALGVRNRLSEAIDTIARAFEINPASRLLRREMNALEPRLGRKARL